MTTGRDKVLSASPFGGFLRSAETVPPEDLQLAMDQITATGLRDRDDGRIAAYANYTGQFESEVRKLVSGAGAEAVLRRELSTQRQREYDGPYELVDHIANRSTVMDLVRRLQDVEVGWAFAVLSMVSDVDARAIAACVCSNDDPAMLTVMYFLVTFVPPEAQSDLLERLLGAPDAFSLACAGELLMKWIYLDILGSQCMADTFLDVVSRAPSPRALSVFGGFLDDLSRWLNYGGLSDDARARADSWLQRIDAVGRSIVVKPANVEAILKAAGRRDLQALAAIAHWQSDEKFPERAAERIVGHAQRLFWREFGSISDRKRDEPLHDAAYPEWVLNPLIHALRHSGLTASQFQEAYDGLACDAFSRMTNLAVWLRDRRRAICLIVVGGYVARLRSDGELLEAVRAATTHAATQPPNDALFGDEEGAKIRQLLGFPIPLA